MRTWPRAALAALVLTGGLAVVGPPRAGAVTVSILAMGDVAGCTPDHQPKASKATVDLIAGLPGQLAILGDVVQGPSAKLVDYKNCFDPFWGRFRSRTRPVPGNHDYLAAGAKGYFDYWGSIGGARGQGYYAWQAGGWRVYALNSNCSAASGCGEGSPMYTLAAGPAGQQLRRPASSRTSTTAGGRGACTDPTRRCRRSTTSSTGPAPSWSCRDTTTPTSGSPPLDPNGQRDPDGIVQVIAGTGGASHYGFTGKGPAPTVKNNTTFGVVALDLSDSSWSLRFVPEAGKSFRDSANGQCRGPNGSL